MSRKRKIYTSQQILKMPAEEYVTFRDSVALNRYDALGIPPVTFLRSWWSVNGSFYIEYVPLAPSRVAPHSFARLGIESDLWVVARGLLIFIGITLAIVFAAVATGSCQ